MRVDAQPRLRRRLLAVKGQAARDDGDMRADEQTAALRLAHDAATSISPLLASELARTSR